jgi:hypothetical protein
VPVAKEPSGRKEVFLIAPISGEGKEKNQIYYLDKNGID